MAFRLLVVLSVVSFALVIACDEKVKPTEVPFAQGALGVEAAAENEPPDLFPKSVFQSTTSGTRKGSVKKRGLYIALERVSPKELEIETNF
jgi:hypothetical protein